MVYFSVTFLCTAGLFLALLEDRYRLWTTVAATVVVYGLALGLAYPIRQLITDPVWGDQVACGAGALLFFVTSLFLYTDNILQKLFVALLSLCDFAFLSFFVPLFLGVLPFPVAGGLAGALSIAAALLFTLLLGLCLYRPLHHYSDRGVSGFLVGMCLLLCFVYLLCLGQFDFLFRARVLAGRLLLAALLYGGMIFCLPLPVPGRAVPGPHRRGRPPGNSMLAMEAGDFTDTLAAVREVQAQPEKATTTPWTPSPSCWRTAWRTRCPSTSARCQEKPPRTPCWPSTTDNPYLSAVIATKAAFAAQNHIEFACSAAVGNNPLKTSELCLVVNELLTRACQDAAAYHGRTAAALHPHPRGGRPAVRGALLRRARPRTSPGSPLKGKSLSQVLAVAVRRRPPPGRPVPGAGEHRPDRGAPQRERLSVSGAPGEDHPPGRRPLLTQPTQYRAALPFLGGGPGLPCKPVKSPPRKETVLMETKTL